jgi:hypothetical protein
MNRILAIAAMCLTLPSLVLLAEEKFDLSRRYKTGERWALVSNGIVEIKDTTTVVLGKSQTFSAPGHTKIDSKLICHVVEARDNNFRIIELQFEQDDREQQNPGEERGVPGHGPLVGKKIRIERRTDPDFHDVKLDLTAEGSAIGGDDEDNLKALFGESPIPATPIAIGAEWDSDRTPWLFGSKNSGTVHVQFAKVDALGGGRRVAILKISGTTRTEIAPKIQPGAGAAGVGVALTATHKFSGTLAIDPENGALVSAEVVGPLTIEHGTNASGKMIQTGQVTLHTKSTPLKPQQEITLRPQPDLPLQVPAYAGGYTDGKLTVELKASDGPQQFTGTIKLADKTYAVKAHAAADRLEGTFDAGTSSFGFTATLDGSTLKLTTADTTYTLKKQGNPLAAPAAGNPTNAPANPLDR